MVTEVTFRCVVGTHCSEGGLVECCSGSFGDGKSESYFLQFHLMMKGCLFFGNMQLKAKKTAIQCQGKKGLFNYLFSCLLFLPLLSVYLTSWWPGAFKNKLNLKVKNNPLLFPAVT